MSSLPFLSTKTPQELSQRRDKPRKRPGVAPSYTPYDKALSDDYRWLKNAIRRKRIAVEKESKRKGKKNDLRGLDWELSKEEWFKLWKELIPPLPIDLPTNGLKNLGSPYVLHVPPWYLRSRGAVPLEKLPQQMLLPSEFKEGRKEARDEAARLWREQSILTPAFKLNLRKKDIHLPYRLDNLRLVLIEVGREKDTGAIDWKRKEVEIWQY
jgi:hypothetical protein